jgi:sulfide:quinone oxidoreductase
MKHVVIIGGGTNALAMAHELADLTRAEDRITVVSDNDEIHCGAAAPWTVARESAHGDLGFRIAPALAAKGIGFSAAGARRLVPQANRLELGDGTTLDYDYLVIASGPRPAYEAIEGLGPNGYTQTLCHAEHSTGCAAAWRRFLESPGPLVVGAVQGATCLAPAYESVLRMDEDLRRRGLRDVAPITFVTPELHIGELGVGGLEDSRELLQSALERRSIEWITEAEVERIEPARVHLTGRRGASARRECHALDFDYAMLMPPFRGIAAVAGIEGLADERGFILVDVHQRNPSYRNIYAAGASVAPAKPAPAGERRSAYLVDAMVSAVAQNIRAEFDGHAPSFGAEWSPVSLADLGASGLAFVAAQEPHARAEDWFERGDWMQMTRCSACNVER